MIMASLGLRVDARPAAAVSGHALGSGSAVRVLKRPSPPRPEAFCRRQCARWPRLEPPKPALRGRRAGKVRRGNQPGSYCFFLSPASGGADARTAKRPSKSRSGREPSMSDAILSDKILSSPPMAATLFMELSGALERGRRLRSWPRRCEIECLVRRFRLL